MARPRGTDNARVIQVIETTALRGEGTEVDKCREVKQYWDFDGNFLVGVCQVKCVNFFVFLWWPGNPATFSM